MIDPRTRRQLPSGRLAGLCVASVVLLSSCRLPELATSPRPATISSQRQEASDSMSPQTESHVTPHPRTPHSPAGEAGGNHVPSAPGSPNASTPNTSTPQRPSFSSTDPLARRLQGVVEDAVARGVTQRAGIAVYDLASGQATGLNPYQSFRPASVIKLAVMVAAYRARSRLEPREFNRLRPDLKRMITISDNPSTRRLVARLGARSVNTAMRELGLDQFRVGESGSHDWVLQGSKASPADAALLLAAIARRQVVSREACDEMLALLGAQERRARIPAGLPSAPDLWVGNKTGTLNGVVNDVGIVLEPSRGIAYTLAIFTAGTRSEAAGNQLLSDLSAVVYSFMTAQHRAGPNQAMAEGARAPAGLTLPAPP